MDVAQKLLTEALDRMAGEGGECLTGVEVVLGSAAGFDVVALRRAFAQAAHGTPAEPAVLEIAWEPSRYWCFDCMYEYSSRSRHGGTCPRCGSSVQTIDHEELAYVRSVCARARLRRGPGRGPALRRALRPSRAEDQGPMLVPW
jgi:Zn finger protein HypA/HybF involved in hydrogenase expression